MAECVLWLCFSNFDSEYDMTCFGITKRLHTSCSFLYQNIFPVLNKCLLHKHRKALGMDSGVPQYVASEAWPFLKSLRNPRMSRSRVASIKAILYRPGSLLLILLSLSKILQNPNFGATWSTPLPKMRSQHRMRSSLGKVILTVENTSRLLLCDSVEHSEWRGQPYDLMQYYKTFKYNGMVFLPKIFLGRFMLRPSVVSIKPPRNALGCYSSSFFLHWNLFQKTWPIKTWSPSAFKNFKGTYHGLVFPKLEDEKRMGTFSVGSVFEN